MISHMMVRKPATTSWLLSPSCMLDRLLDHIEKLGSVVAPVQARNPPYADSKIETRAEQFGA